MVKFELLGTFRVEIEGETVTRFRTQKTASLLAYLAANPGLHPRDELVSLLWPGSDVEAGRTSLRTALAALRKQLEPHGTDEGSVLIADRQRVGLNDKNVETDAGAFEEALHSASIHHIPIQRADALVEAIRLFKRPFLADLEEGWERPLRERYNRMFSVALKDASVAYSQAGQVERALELALKLLELNPHSEEAHLHLIQLLVSAGNRSEARERVRKMVQTLRQELGAEPSSTAQSIIASLNSEDALSIAVSPSVPPDALACAPAISTVLPTPLTKFFGREDQIPELLDLLQNDYIRLVTLTGAGGSGKTRLALEVLRRVVEQGTFKGGIIYVPLADVTDARFIGDAILQVVKADRSPQMTAIEQVVHMLPPDRCLLVLDNFEQLVEEGTDYVLSIINDAPQVCCLVTSRQRLDIGGENEIAVRPFQTPRGRVSLNDLQGLTSVQLFVDRAGAARMDFALNSGNAAAVAAICDRVDGIPLAIELAATWVSALTPAQILDRLEQSFGLLASRRRDLAPRHRTLKTTIEWSYQLLSPELQRFFARLSVFRGGWTLESAETVCAERNALEFLQNLHDRSLIAIEESGSVMRYRFLETLREFAREQLSPEEAEALLERHARWCLRLAESARGNLTGVGQAEWLKKLEAEHDNFRAALRRTCATNPDIALRLACALDRFWEIRGFIMEGLEWLERSLAKVEANAPLRPIGLELAGRFAWFTNRFDEARSWFAESLELSRARGPESVIGPLAHVARLKAFVDGHTAEARTLLMEALEIARRVNDTGQILNILEMLSQVSLIEGDGASAAEHAAELIVRARGAEDASFVVAGLVLHGIGTVNCGENDIARADFEEALERSVDLGETYWSAGALWGLGVIGFVGGDYPKAHEYLCASLTRLRTTGFEVVKHYVLDVQAVLAAAQGDGIRAARLLGAVAELQKNSHAPIARILHLDFSKYIAHARATVGDAIYDKAYSEAGSMTMAEAVEYALSE